jgi:hypothetical protein
MKINANPIADSDVRCRVVEFVIEWSIDGGDFGNDADRAGH